jgi:alanyl-tRNA synthetase
MRNLTSRELRQLFLDFFKEKGHAVIDSASLIPENDPTVLFTTAGMHPLVQYSWAKASRRKRIDEVQKCVRTAIRRSGDARLHVL